MNLLLVDHEDSFVFNLYQAFAVAGANVDCVRWGASLERATSGDPEAIVLSPGPGAPSDRRLTRLSRELVDRYHGERPILGVCLGHQLLGELHGGRVVRAARPVHGETAAVQHDGSALFDGMPNPFAAARYHSLVLQPRSVPRELSVTAWSRDGVVMGIAHRSEPTFGCQFHPESFLTAHGAMYLSNFLREVRR